MLKNPHNVLDNSIKIGTNMLELLNKRLAGYLLPVLFNRGNEIESSLRKIRAVCREIPFVRLVLLYF